MLLVTGANGFIGTAVCAAAVRAGLEVVGVARRGSPQTAGLEKVRWHRLDVFDTPKLTPALRGVTAVVHCVGIARERPSRKETFRRVNGDSAIAVAEAAREAGAQTFVFISAAEKPPWAHEEYLSSKRRAEVALGKLGMRVVVVRPGLVYGDARPMAKLAAATLKVAQGFKVDLPFVRGNAPLDVEALAKAIIRAVQDERVQGVIEYPRLAELGAAVTSG